VNASERKLFIIKAFFIFNNHRNIVAICVQYPTSKIPPLSIALQKREFQASKAPFFIFIPENVIFYKNIVCTVVRADTEGGYLSA
jgi:hypothetical protein